jgi:S1-C subfamily serine protease
MRDAEQRLKQCVSTRTHMTVCAHDRGRRSTAPSSAFLRQLLVMGILALLAIVTVAQVQVAHAAGFQAATDPVKEAVELAKPAVVRIYTSVVGRLLVHFPTGDVEFPQNAEGYALTLSGCGTFISSHGDILTADHLITPPSQVFADVAASDVTAYVNQHGTYGMQLSVDQVNLALTSGQIRSDALYRSKSSEVYLSTSYTGLLSATSLQTLPTTIHQTVDSVEAESSFDQKDVAIVHSPFSDTPSVPLADSSQVQQLDDLTIIGFPGNGDVSDRPTNLLTSSVNTVTVSSIKTTDSGAPVIQIGGNVEPGDSGGPAIDSNGRIVGTVSFGLSDGSPGATSFLQASNSARTLIGELRLNAAPGVFEKDWSQAYSDYAGTTPGHWHKAAQELAKLSVAYPLFQSVMPYLLMARAQAATEQIPQLPEKSTGENSSISSFILWLPLLAGIAGVFILLVMVSFLIRAVMRHHGKRGSTPPSVRFQAMQLPYRPTAIQTSLGGTYEHVRAPSQVQDTVACGKTASESRACSERMLTAGAEIWQRPFLSAVGALRSWPCGHQNRPAARFCRACGVPYSDTSIAAISGILIGGKERQQKRVQE